ncbi:hypothetical protein [Cytobacillus oceanisediminis]|uniref:hypothetical protein n=1 Tax=Cytobacillus oceanisediminis TaxID=665099 RepID=UPI0016434F8F|nr:hypothetical protein [Cytobacillus oceanisediminis]
MIVGGDEKEVAAFNMLECCIVNDDEEEEEYDRDECVRLVKLGKRRLPEKILEWDYC